MDESTLVKSARGSAYSLTTNAATMVLGFIRSVLLMRLLDPEYFGVVALSLFFTTLISPFSVFGIDNVLIQKKDPSKVSYSTHFVLRIILGILVMLLGILFSPLMLRLYEYQKTVVYIFLFLLLFKLIEASYSTQNIVMRRELRFGPLALLNLISSLAMTIIAPLMAYLGAGIWSLVAEQVIGPIIRWIGFWLVLHPWRPSLKFNLEQARSLLRFGSIYMSSNLLGILLDRFDDFWVGTYLGSRSLGYYSRAYALAQYPKRIIATPIVNVFLPTYAAVQNNKIELSKAFFRSSSFLIRSGFLLALVLMITAPEFTIILFTATWLPIVPIFRLMLVYILLNPFYVNLSYLLAGIGQPFVLTRTRIVQTAFFIVAVISFAYLWGVNGVAVAANLMMFMGTIILIVEIRKFVSFSLSRMLRWPIVALLLASIAGLLVINYCEYLNIWSNLLLKGSVVTIVYLFTLYIAEREIFHEYSVLVFQPMWEKIKSIRE
ncbi:oligosaccharide flippase family protein [Chloroflexota bacterium]